MKNLFFAILIIFFSCKNDKSSSSQKKEGLELTILNNSINVPKINFEDLPAKRDYIYSTEEKNFGRNVIEFYIKNNSKKKYALALNQNLLEYNDYDSGGKYDSCYYCKRNKIFYEFDNKQHFTYYSSHFQNLELEKKHIIYNKKISEELKDLKIPVIDEDIEFSKTVKDDLIVLQPGETKYFKKIIYLPFINGVNKYSTQLSCIKFNPNKQYKFNLRFFADSSLMKKVMKKSIANKLMKNNVSIFDGTLVSNKVIVKFINLK